MGNLFSSCLPSENRGGNREHLLSTDKNIGHYSNPLSQPLIVVNPGSEQQNNEQKILDQEKKISKEGQKKEDAIDKGAQGQDTSLKINNSFNPTYSDGNSISEISTKSHLDKPAKKFLNSYFGLMPDQLAALTFNELSDLQKLHLLIFLSSKDPSKFTEWKDIFKRLIDDNPELKLSPNKNKYNAFEMICKFDNYEAWDCIKSSCKDSEWRKKVVYHSDPEAENLKILQQYLETDYSKILGIAIKNFKFKLEQCDKLSKLNTRYNQLKMIFKHQHSDRQFETEFKNKQDAETWWNENEANFERYATSDVTYSYITQGERSLQGDN
jgi:hypothetical protein